MEITYTPLLFVGAIVVIFLAALLAVYLTSRLAAKEVVSQEVKYRIVKTTKGSVVTYNPQIWLENLDHWASRYGRPTSYSHWAEITDVNLHTREQAEQAIVHDKELYLLDEKRKRESIKQEVVYEE